MKQEQKHFIFGGEKVSFGLPLSSEQYLEAKHLQLELKGTLLLLKQIEVSFWWVFNRKHFKLDLTRVFEYVEFKNLFASTVKRSRLLEVQQQRQTVNMQAEQHEKHFWRSITISYFNKKIKYSYLFIRWKQKL